MRGGVFLMRVRACRKYNNSCIKCGLKLLQLRRYNKRERDVCVYGARFRSGVYSGGEVQ